MKKATIILKKPYVFEEEEYTELDMTGFANLKGSQLYEAEQRYLQVRQSPIGMEYTLGFAFALGSIVTGKPIEFFANLPAPDANSFRNWVTCFLLGTITITDVPEISEKPQ